jgi:hypothetical protein
MLAVCGIGQRQASRESGALLREEGCDGGAQEGNDKANSHQV